MAINKIQGQTLQRCDLYFPRPIFTHGQFHIALPRVRDANSIRILLQPGEGQRFFIR